MDSICIRGLVTRYSNYKENDRIITVLTSEYGQINAKARGCRKAKSPLIACCQPFVYAEFELVERKGRYIIQRGDVLESFFPIREDIRRFAIASSMLQLAQEAAKEGEPAPELFDLLYHCLSYLSYGTIEPEDLIDVYLLRYLDAIGYRPMIVRCAICGRDVRADRKLFFSLRHGGTVCCGCCSNRGEPVSKVTLEAMRRILLLKNSELQKVVLSESIRKDMQKCLVMQIENTLEYGSRALKFYQQYATKTTDNYCSIPENGV